MTENKPAFIPLLVDAHEDLAVNMLDFQRDYTLSAGEIRQGERGSRAVELFGDALLGWPDYQRGRVGVVFSTLFGMPGRLKSGDWETQSYDTALQARKLYRGQLDHYRRLVDEHPDQFRLVEVKKDLEEVLVDWDNPQKKTHPVGLVILMEGAEAISDPGELEEWWEWGLRIIGPAWAGNRFCGGTREPGPLTKEGFGLLESMAGLGFTLDVSHMDARAALQALEVYPERVIASHSNALARLKGMEGNRHLPDEVVRGLIDRQGIIGIVLYNGFLSASWKKGDPRQKVTLQHVVAQIDYICQMAGDALHVGIGSDFDGGFGLQSVPAEIDTIADLQKLVPLLLDKGYSKDDVTGILGGNWLRTLRNGLPEVR